MSRTTWRALRTELLRSVAPVAALAMFAAAAGMLYSEAADWAGQWMPFAAAVRSGMFVTGALAVVAGAWQAGRERRRHITEQLDTIPRPAWQPVLVAWAGVTIGCWLGLLIAVGAGAALVAPVATYSGGGWWWLIVVAFIALAALSALGDAIGRLIPYGLVGPVVAILFYTLLIYIHEEVPNDVSYAEWLVPAVRIHESVGSTLPLGLHVQQVAWFGGLAAALLVLSAARRRIFAIIPAVAAATGAVLLTTGSVEVREWKADPAARELVCTDDGLVCLSRAEAFLLDDVTPFAREVLARLDGVPGAPTQAVGRTHSFDVVDETSIRISTGDITITGDLDTGEASRIASWAPDLRCESTGEATHLMRAAVDQWTASPPQGWDEPRVLDAARALEAMPDTERKAWLGELIAAAEQCDTEALDELAEAVQ